MNPIELVSVLEITVLAGLAAVAELLVKSAFWRRMMWRGCLIAAVAILMAQWTGLSRVLARPLLDHMPVQRKVAAWKVSYGSSNFHAAPALVSARTGKPISASIKPWLLALWIWRGGMILLLGRFALAQLWGILAVRRMPLLADEPLGREIRRMGIRRSVAIRTSAGPSPLVFGLMRPTLVLPADFRDRFNSCHQEAILAHELAHISARDPFWFALAEAAATLWWWHPLIWWARGRLRLASEMAADEAALTVRDGGSHLAECLVQLAKEMAAAQFWTAAAIDGGRFQSSLGRRVQRLLQMTGHSAPSLPGARQRWAAAAVSSVAVVLFCGGAGLADNDSTNSPVVKKINTNSANVLQLGSVNHHKAQVLLASELFEIHLQTARKLGLNWMLDGPASDQPLSDTPTILAVRKAFHGKVLTNSVSAESKKVLTESAYTTLTNSLRHQAISWLGAPRVVSLSGMPCSVASQGFLTVPLEKGAPPTISTSVGIEVSETATVLADGNSIALNAISTDTTKVTEAGLVFRQLHATETIHDGETLVLAGVTPGENGPSIVVTFITAHIIDAAGNWVHPRPTE